MYFYTELSQLLLRRTDGRLSDEKIEQFAQQSAVQQQLNRFCSEFWSYWAHSNSGEVKLDNAVAQSGPTVDDHALNPSDTGEQALPGDHLPDECHDPADADIFDPLSADDPSLSDETDGIDETPAPTDNQTATDQQPSDINRLTPGENSSDADMTEPLASEKEATSAEKLDTAAGIKPGQFANVAAKKRVTMPHRPTLRFIIPNGMTKKPYQHRIKTDDAESVEIRRIDGLEALGLTFSIEQQCLEGTPLVAGEHLLIVYYRLADQDHKQQQPFLVNHDPRSLWKNIPSDRQNTLYWKPDQATKGINDSDQFQLIGASQRGRSHANHGTCRDDDFKLIAEDQSGWRILAVADGAGSSEFSREGARLAVETATARLSEQLTAHDSAITQALRAWQQVPTDAHSTAVKKALYPAFSVALYDAVKAIYAAVEEQGCASREFYTTLLLTAHKWLDGKHYLIGYWIGDGGLVIYDAGQSVHLLGDIDSGEYAGQTRFLDNSAVTQEDIFQRIRFDCRETMTALLLMSDGISDPVFETDQKLKTLRYWDEFWCETIRPRLASEPQQSAENILSWMDFWSPGNHDDRTLALLCRREVSS